MSFAIFTKKHVDHFRLSTLCEDIKNDELTWREFCASTNPIEGDVPSPYTNANQIIKLLIYKCLRPDAIYAAIEKFICSFDESFMHSQQINLKSAFECSTSKSPLIYFTSPGTSASADILNLASEMNLGER